MNEIAAPTLFELIASDPRVILLDCRGADYFAWEHITGARNLRWKYVTERAAQVLPDKSQTIVTYCDSILCDASLKAYETLKSLGYENLIEFSGGITEWKAHGFPTRSDQNCRISEHTYRFPNQKYYGEFVGSYLIEEDDFILLIDGPQNLTEEHEDFIESFGKPIKIFLTHGSTAGETEILQKKHGATVYLHSDDQSSAWLAIKPDSLFSDDFDLSLNLKVIHAPGHSPGSSCVFDKRSGFLFSGDQIAGNKRGNILPITHDVHAQGSHALRIASATKLFGTRFESIWPFHYLPIKTAGHQKLIKWIRENT